jgi:mannose-6-phosphate isomerase-like protein (cupin superfamily)
MMIKTALAAAAALALAGAAPARAQAPAPDMKTYASSADVQALIANARKIHKAEPTLSQPILSLAPYRASLEYRTAVGPAAVHEKEAEFFYVIDGSGVLVTGGRLKDEKRQNAANLGGTGIDGGQSRAVAKGDFIVVPEATPHWFSDIKGELILMSLHVPRG